MDGRGRGGAGHGAAGRDQLAEGLAQELPLRAGRRGAVRPRDASPPGAARLHVRQQPARRAVVHHRCHGFRALEPEPREQAPRLRGCRPQPPVGSARRVPGRGMDLDPRVDPGLPREGRGPAGRHQQGHHLLHHPPADGRPDGARRLVDHLVQPELGGVGGAGHRAGARGALRPAAADPLLRAGARLAGPRPHRQDRAARPRGARARRRVALQRGQH